MAREIWLGPLLGNNRSRLIERCAELVARGEPERFLYLAASHPLLELITQGMLDGAQNRGVWGELPVYLFRGFVRRLLATGVDGDGNRLSPRVPIDQEELPLKRSLISQILASLTETGALKAIGPLANREGCVNSIATLIGEIERAAKSPEQVSEIIAARTSDLLSPRDEPAARRLHTQNDFDREVELIYTTYCQLLDRHLLTEADADQRRALSVLQGEVDGHAVRVPWLANVQLLILDGFFDFTPVQGEILRLLIPQFPEVLVNLNHDERNPEIFLPFQETIGHLSSIVAFEVKPNGGETRPASGALSELRQNLFNPALGSVAEIDEQQKEIRYFECGDRDTEVRQVAKEIKRLVLTEGYSLAEIALVVRQRAAYSETIARVMREESLPCNIESRVEANDIPANRAALKVFAILEQLSADEASAPRVSQFADLIKSEYFRLDKKDLAALLERFETEFSQLLRDNGKPPDPVKEEKLRQRFRIGVWDADALENAFAYVGSELRVSDWLKRAGKLITELPGAAATRELLNIDAVEQARAPDEADQIENAETAPVDLKDVERKRRPSRDIHPAALAWTSLVLHGFAEKIVAVEREGTPAQLRQRLLKLFEDLNFRQQITRPLRSLSEDKELPQAVMNYNSLDALRRAFVAAIKSIEIAASIKGASHEPVVTTLRTFIEEARRALSSQSQVYRSADRSGLRVLEATDVRGLCFRVVFIAGLIEGGFPLRASRDWIYPHEERERLKRYGLTLEDISPATLLKEEHYFYQAACRATERLYLTRPLALEDDAETVASYYIDELRRAVAPLKIEPETIRRDYEGRELDKVSSTGELRTTLIRQQERHFHRGDKRELLLESQIKRLLTLARNDELVSSSALRRIEIERERAGARFGPYDGFITDPDLLRLIERRFGADMTHSASSLSTYGNCGYRFFGQRVLRLEPRGEAALDLQAIDAGKLLHDILRRFFERHRRQSLSQLDRDALRAELLKLADNVFDEHERVVPPLNRQIWKIDREIRKILLDQVLLYELSIQEQAAANEVLPAYFEMAFGGLKSSARDPSSTERALELTRATFVGEEAIKISGQIDRVDIAADDTLIAYDYKLSTGSSKEDIRSGRSLQLPIYLEALEKLLLPNHAIAGGGYYIIRGANDRRNKGLHRATGLQYSKLRANVNAVLSDEEWQQIRRETIAKIWDFLDHMRAGEFPVNPSQKEKTCRFCDFAAVCRYDRYRIEGKKRQQSLREDTT
ncbi:MAG TPA: PD-(D/E)XK nuclease family protein [Pyrinomonadaceae bacterium]|nr:PD-(D/E)XK nuclease family protein [Pyrinomonadaceae bacterium]